MGYYRRYNRQPRQNNPELVARIEAVAARGVKTLSDWERTFMGYLLESAKKWGRLTAKQHDIFQRIEKKTDPEHIEAMKAWRQEWSENPERAHMLRFAAGYYMANPPYYREVAQKILNDSSYVPSEKLYHKMVMNKYVQRAYENSQEAVKYPAGTMVAIRDSANVPSSHRNFRGKLAMVIEVAQDHLHATRGTRQVTILPIGSINTLLSEERYLKPSRI